MVVKMERVKKVVVKIENEVSGSEEGDIEHGNSDDGEGRAKRASTNE